MIHKKHLAQCWYLSINISYCYSLKSPGCRWWHRLSSGNMVPCKWLKESSKSPKWLHLRSFSLCDLIDGPEGWTSSFLGNMSTAVAPSKLNKTESVFRLKKKLAESRLCNQDPEGEEWKEHKAVTQGNRSRIQRREPDVSRRPISKKEKGRPHYLI